MYIKYNKHEYFSKKKSNSKNPLDSVQSNTRENKTHNARRCNQNFLFFYFYLPLRLFFILKVNTVYNDYDREFVTESQRCAIECTVDD